MKKLSYHVDDKLVDTKHFEVECHDDIVHIYKIENWKSNCIPNVYTQMLSMNRYDFEKFRNWIKDIDI